MKKGKLVFALLFSMGFFNLIAQDNSPKNYLVIGVFKIQENAVRRTEMAQKFNFSAQYAINPSQNFYYVYILETEDRKHAFAQVLKTRMETDFKDAWVFTGTLGEKQGTPVVKQAPVEPVVETKPEPVVVSAPVVEAPKPVVETPPVVEA